MDTKYHGTTTETEGRSNDDKPSEVIIMQGWLEKQSNHLKKWRKRWTIIIKRESEYFMETYKKITILNNENNNNPTAIINIDKNLKIKEHEFSDDTKGFIITINSNKLSFEFKVYSIYNHTINDWINCIERIKYKQFPLKTSSTINRISNNHKLDSVYLFKQNSSEIIIDDHYKYIFLYYLRIYLINDNDGKLIKLIMSYFDDIDNIYNIKYVQCFQWIRNLSILQNIETQRYYTPTIVYHSFDENCGAEKAGYYFSRNLFVKNANYFPFNKTNDDNNIYFSIFRIGAPNICDLIMMNKNELNVKNNFNDQDIDLFYHQLPSFKSNIIKPSIIYHNNHLFAVGGYSKDYIFEKKGLNDIYCLNLTKSQNEWKCITNKTKLKIGKFGSCLSFLTGNMLMIIGGCNKENILTKSVECYQFENNQYILNNDQLKDNNNNNKKKKNKTITLNNTQCQHFNAGIVKNIGYNHNKLCIGSNNNVEIYDGFKDLWINTKNTNKIHLNPKLWLNKNNQNIVYIASKNGMEWMDIRKQNKFWTLNNIDNIDNTNNNNNNNNIFDTYYHVQIV